MSDAADHQPPASASATASPAPDEPPRESDEERFSKLLRTKRAEFLDHLLRSLDMVAYCQFSYLYFLDCSLFRFLIRSAVQLNFLTPKPPNFPPQSQRRPAIVALLGSTLFCFLWHVLSAPPSAGEMAGGYLHGGLIIDFIGQEGPISKLRLAAMDAAIAALQITMLALVVSKQEVAEAHARAAELLQGTPAVAAAGQDLESEERGEVRQFYRSDDGDGQEREQEERLMEVDEDGGMQEEEEGDVRVRERERTVCEITAGEFVAVELGVVDVVRRQWRKGGQAEEGARGMV